MNVKVMALLASGLTDNEIERFMEILDLEQDRRQLHGLRRLQEAVGA